MTCVNSRSKCGVLMGGVPESSMESGRNSCRHRSLIFRGFSQFTSSVVSWNADSILSWSKYLERGRRKAKIIIHYGPYRELLFYFWRWIVYDVSTPREHSNVLKIKNFNRLETCLFLTWNRILKS